MDNNLESPTKADLQLAALFCDGAVLQSDRPLPLWGWGAPSRRVRVLLAGQAANGWISSHGDFRVILPPLPAGGPHVLRVELPESPEVPALIVRYLWIGDVWLASGQSNMEWKLELCGESGLKAAAAADDPLLRIFTVEKRAELAPQRDVEGAWWPAHAASAPEFSAVAYHFARKLREELGVAVGVIVSAWGGTTIEAWMPRRTHAASPLLREKLRDYESRAYSDGCWTPGNAAAERLFPSDPGRTDRAATWGAPETCDADWPIMNLPATWQSYGHGISGVFWFRKAVVIPPSWVGCDLLLNLGAADKHDITFVNGAEVGRTGKDLEIDHWAKPRVYRVPASLVTGRDVVIAVRVYSFVHAGGLLGPAEQMNLACPADGDRTVPISGEWRYCIEHDFGHVAEGALGHLSRKSPCILYDNMIAPLAPYALRGVLWYQGESNALQEASVYPSHLRSLVLSWQEDWQIGEFPFLIVQLPGYGKPAGFFAASTWALIRQGQLDLVRTMSGVGLAVTLDCGEADELHPRNKEPVGHRLALWALSETYGRPVLKCGPLPRDASLHADGRVRVSFDCAGSRLATADGLPVGGVFLLGEDQEAYPAETGIDGDVLWASADACPQPVAVCYAWADFPLGANLVNREGLPASPFRLMIDFRPAGSKKCTHNHVAAES